MRQQELEYYTGNFETMGVQAAMLAGWLFDQASGRGWGSIAGLGKTEFVI